MVNHKSVTCPKMTESFHSFSSSFRSNVLTDYTPGFASLSGKAFQRHAFPRFQPKAAELAQGAARRPIKPGRICSPAEAQNPTHTSANHMHCPASEATVWHRHTPTGRRIMYAFLFMRQIFSMLCLFPTGILFFQSEYLRFVDFFLETTGVNSSHLPKLEPVAPPPIQLLCCSFLSYRSYSSFLLIHCHTR